MDQVAYLIVTGCLWAILDTDAECETDDEFLQKKRKAGHMVTSQGGSICDQRESISDQFTVRPWLNITGETDYDLKHMATEQLVGNGSLDSDSTTPWLR